MFQAVKEIASFIKAKGRNCSPLCAHCEVEVSENTALAISKLLDRRIKEVPGDLGLVTELRYQKELILRGAWHEDYEKLFE